MTELHRVWTGSEWIELPVPVSSGEPVVVPNIAGVVFRGSRRDEILLQRRDKPGEVVRGRLELPGGRWRAGELPDVALAREVAEETGVDLLAVSAAVEHRRFEPHVAFGIARPVAVVSGAEGSYPAIHVLFECRGEGEPRPQPGETAEPRWWGVADVLEHLHRHPEDFIWHTRAMLEAYFGL
jgi:8-oxo-dGTP pyrophosphatase MutT (NUDIX family)